MAEATPAPSPEPAQPQTQSPAPQPSPLEKVYNDFKIEDTAATFKPEPQTPAQPAQPAPAFKSPDPFDPNFGAWQQGVTGAVATVNQAVSQTAQELQKLRHDLHSERTEADIERAASVISEEAGIKPKLAKALLEVEAREDPRFKNLWANRQKNPAAWDAAQKALAAKLKEEYTVRHDPQIAENVRAMKSSQQQMATTTKQETEQSRFDNMTPAERQREVQKMMRLGGR